jgi:hypothetical protein
MTIPQMPEETVDIYLTRLRVNKDTFGGAMYLQGDQVPLSWDTGNGIVATWTSGNWWEVLIDGLSGSFEYKWQIDGSWEGGGNHVGTAGVTNEASWQN